MKILKTLGFGALALALVLGTVAGGLLPQTASAQTALVANITQPADNSNYTVGQAVTFVGAATGGVAPYSYVWNFGDGSQAFGQTQTKTYTTTGAKTVTLRITDSNGTQATRTITLNNGSNNQNVTVTFVSPTQGQTFNVGQNINFQVNVTGGTAPYTYQWNFGNVSSSTSANPTFAFTSAGTYTITATVRDANNNTGSASVTITIGTGNTNNIVISNVRVTNVTQTSATIQWDTNIAATSRVIYDTTSHANISGQTAPNYGYAQSTGETDVTTKVTAHSVTLTGLNPGTRYYFRVISQ